MTVTASKRLLIGIVLCLASTFTFAIGGVPARGPQAALRPLETVPQTDIRSADYEPNTLIIQIKPEAEAYNDFQTLASGGIDTGLDSLDRLLDQYVVQKVHTSQVSQSVRASSGTPQLLKLELEPGHDPLEIAGIFSQDPNIELAEPNYIYHSTYIPNDPLFPEQWGLQNMGGWPDADIAATEAWDIERGDASIIIAIIDTGVNWMHNDLAANIWRNSGEIQDNGIDDDHNGYIDDIRGWDFVTSTWLYPGEDGDPEDNDPDDFHGHGTHVAGIAAAAGNNGVGISGVCPKCTIMPLRAGFMDGNGNGSFYLFDVANAIYYAANNGAHVINMSFAGLGMPLIMDQAIQYAYEKNIVMIAAAGNHNDDFVFQPAAYPQVIGVAATDSYDQRTSFSAYGYDVDLAAPGSSIISTIPGGSYSYMSGTSMASPMVAGVAGLILSRNPHLTAEQVRTILISTADPKPFNKYIGSGRLNANQALQMTNVPIAVLQWPARLEFLSGVVHISGTAGGIDFSHLIVDYGAGDNPSDWHILSESTTPVIEGTLGVWNTSGLPNGLYIIRLRVFDNSGNTSLALRPVYVQHDLLPNWPQYVGEFETLAPLIADINGDDQLEIVVAMKGNGMVFVWQPDGSNLPGWPVQAGHNLHGSAAAADMNGDGRMEIVITSQRNMGLRFPNYLSVYRYDGSLLPGWPLEVGGQQFLTPALGDIDGDGQMEIVVSTSLDDADSSFTGVFIYKLDGTLLPGWPKSFPITEHYIQPWSSGPVLGDLTGNGSLDVVVGFIGGEVYAWNGSGQVLPGWPKTMNPLNPPNQRGVPKLVLGDVDNNGTLEVVAGNTVAEVRVWRANGQLMPGWPYTIPYFSLGPPALGDLNGDGNLEIVAHCNNNDIYAWRSDGSLLSGWPARIEETYGYPSWDQALITDVNDDGKQDVILPSLKKAIIALQGDGSPVPGWHKPMHGPGSFTPAIADLTGDGELELMAGTNAYFYVWRLNSPAGRLQWNMFQANPQRTGRHPAAHEYQPTAIAPTASVTPQEPDIPLPTPTPISTSLPPGTPTPQPLPGKLQPEIYVPIILSP
jgi:subtilisin family serine protease